MSEVASKDKKPGRKIGNNSLYIGIGLVAAVVVLTVGTFLLLRSTKVVDPVALKVGEVEIKQSQLDEYINLGKSSGVTESTVRKTVIEYAKNTQMAKKHEVDMPQEFVSWYSKNSIASALPIQGHAGQGTNNNYSKLVSYNLAFGQRVAEANYNGRGIFLYDIVPQLVSGDDAEKNKSKEKAKQDAQRLRDAVSRGELPLEQLLEDLTRDNESGGVGNESTFKFIHEYTGPKEDIWVGSLASAAYVYETIKGGGVGISKVEQSNKGGAWFAYTLYVQSKQPELAGKIAEDKLRMKVVEYDG